MRVYLNAPHHGAHINIFSDPLCARYILHALLLTAEGEAMRRAPSTILQSMRTGLNYSATTAKELYYRAHNIVNPKSTRHIPIERVISEFLSSLNQPNFRVLCKHLTPKLSRKVRVESPLSPTPRNLQ